MIATWVQLVTAQGQPSQQLGSNSWYIQKSDQMIMMMIGFEIKINQQQIYDNTWNCIIKLCRDISS